MSSCSPSIGAVVSTIDDENSQAEGSSEGAVGFMRSEQQQSQNNSNNNPTANHRHYENIYESIEQYNGAVQGVAGPPAPAIMAASVASNNNNANAPAEEQVSQQQQQSPPTIENLANNNILQPQYVPQQPQLRLFNNNNNINYRNDLYDRSNVIGSGTCNRQDNINNNNSNNTNYDVPRSVRSGLGFRRNFQLDLQAGIFDL